jgi:uncharacterized coiled-coil protein SlyX
MPLSLIQFTDGSILTGITSSSTVNDPTKAISAFIFNSTINSINEQLSTLYEIVFGMDGRITALENRMGLAEGSITTISGLIDTINSEITTINASLSTHSSTISTLQTDLGLLQGEVSTLSSTITGIQSSLSSINTELTDHEDRIYALETATPSTPPDPPYLLVTSAFISFSDGASHPHNLMKYTWKTSSTTTASIVFISCEFQSQSGDQWKVGTIPTGYRPYNDTFIATNTTNSTEIWIHGIATFNTPPYSGGTAGDINFLVQSQHAFFSVCYICET